jgi:hypothetical protein
MHRRSSFESSFKGDNQVGALKIGRYVNTQDGLTAFIFEGDREESPTYQVAICERDEERTASANELALWVPIRACSTEIGCEPKSLKPEMGQNDLHGALRCVTQKEFPLQPS